MKKLHCKIAPDWCESKLCCFYCNEMKICEHACRNFPDACGITIERGNDYRKPGGKARPVRQYTLDGKFVMEHGSFSKASVYMRMNHNYLNTYRFKCEDKNNFEALGYIWRAVESEE